MAAKNDYFGVGGGVLSFTDFMQASQQFVVDTVKRIDAGKYFSFIFHTFMFWVTFTISHFFYVN